MLYFDDVQPHTGLVGFLACVPLILLRLCTAALLLGLGMAVCQYCSIQVFGSIQTITEQKLSAHLPFSGEIRFLPINISPLNHKSVSTDFHRICHGFSLIFLEFSRFSTDFPPISPDFPPISPDFPRFSPIFPHFPRFSPIFPDFPLKKPVSTVSTGGDRTSLVPPLPHGVQNWPSIPPMGLPYGGRLLPRAPRSHAFLYTYACVNAD